MNTHALAQKGIGELQRSLERFENYNDGFILPDTFLVVRLDAHRLGAWDDALGEYPCAPGITKAFHDTARLLMTSSFRVLLAYAHGDEISLLIDPSESANPMRRSKLISTIASAAAVHFLKVSGREALFEAKLSELPSSNRVLEYFFWQRRYCFRNATTIALRRALLNSGKSAEEAERSIHGIAEKDRLAKLTGLGVALESIPHATRRGTLFFWSSAMRDGREHFRITSDAMLADSDDQYLSHLQQVISEILGHGAAPGAAQPAHVAVNHDSVIQPVGAIQPAESQRKREYKPNKKTNVSVFKMSRGAARGS